MKPSAYKHIAAFCRVTRLHDEARRALQRFASATYAPVDVVYYDHSEDHWATIAECGVRTRMAIEIELNRGKR